MPPKTRTNGIDSEDDSISGSGSESDHAYEEERKKRIERNKELLSSLGLDKSILNQTKPNEKTKKQRKSSTSTSTATKTRRSKRLSQKPKPNYSDALNNYRTSPPKPKAKPKKKKEKKTEVYGLKGRRKSKQQDDDSTDDEESAGSRRSSRLKKKKPVSYTKFLENGEDEEEYKEEEEIQEEDNENTGVEEISEILSDYEDSPKKKKIKSNPVVMFTGITKPQQYFHIIEELGGEIEENETAIQRVTHLITNQFKRTLKMMCGIAACNHILTMDWVKACQLSNRFVDEETFIVTSDQIDLKEVMLKAKTTPVFKGLNFFITSKTLPKPVELERIIECNGGTVLTDDVYQFKRSIEDGEVEINEDLVIVSTEKEKDLCQQLIDELNIPKFCFKLPEFVFQSVCTQSLCNSEDMF